MSLTFITPCNRYSSHSGNNYSKRKSFSKHNKYEQYFTPDILMDELGQNETVHLQPDLAFKKEVKNNDTNIGNDTSLEFEHVDQNKTLKAYLIKQNVTSKENVSVSPGSNFSSIKTVTTTSNNLQNTSIETTEVNHDEKINPQLNSFLPWNMLKSIVKENQQKSSYKGSHQPHQKERLQGGLKEKFQSLVFAKQIQALKLNIKSASTKGSKEASDFKNLGNDEMGKDMEETQRASQDTLTTPTLGRTFHLKKVDFYKEKNKSTHEESVFTSMSAMSKYSSTDSGK
ncbi:unnamed protein product [Lepeophtheirus salmonis]|uniref:(salmon louse) hypothetical protein n=1 Tax=Lepeophtheirus salmonis TaxID=72036 RepID=A0A7R8H4D8_LEPSM|nr:unnamed protein product [Lepeophtheirus salmonis]CAF2860995.1 unnamed protein product [Lepeophtheirus salmonis]